MSTKFRPELKEPSAREAFILYSDRERKGGELRRDKRDHSSSLARLERASELKKKAVGLNLTSRRLYKLQATRFSMLLISIGFCLAKAFETALYTSLKNL